MKRKPTGFVATCQCGVVTGALDLARSEPADVSRLLGKWLADGCTVEPRFDGTWSAAVGPCTCNPRAAQKES